MTSPEHFERKISTLCFILVVAFGIIFPYGSACAGKFNSNYFFYVVSWSKTMARFFITLFNSEFYTFKLGLCPSFPLEIYC